MQSEKAMKKQLLRKWIYFRKSRW